MSIDLSQFIGDFLEESYEGLAVMEAQLLDFNGSDETVNTIFRAAHSIKGGAGTFGFNQVADFTHKVETLLDEVRKTHIVINPSVANLLLQSVDIIRDMLEVTQGGEINEEIVASVEKQLEQVLHPQDVPEELTDEQPDQQGETLETEVQESTAQSGWLIHFKPEQTLLQGGNEPAYLFEALQEFGDLTIDANLENIPTLEDYHAQSLYLSWQLTLVSSCERADIAEIFDWVEDCCELTVTALNSVDDQHRDNLVLVEENETETPNSSMEVVEPSEGANESASETESQEASRNNSFTESSSVRVEISKIDALMNRVGELVITQAMLSQAGETLEKSGVVNERLVTGLSQLERNTKDLQEDVMRVRMLPISFVFNRFPRLVHDASGKLGKKVELVINGAQTEIDKTVMEKIGDPLVHLVRNALDHGLETPQQRIEAGKPETGTIELSAYHQNGSVVIDIADDGMGLNIEKIRAKALERGLISDGQKLTSQEVNDLIFKAGFSTADQVSDLSGRGVGMDVVRRNMESLGGQVSITSQEGKGSKITVRLPLTLAILEGQIIKVQQDVFIIPLVAIIETVLADHSVIKSIGSDSRLLNFRDEYIHLIDLAQLFVLNETLENEKVVNFDTPTANKFLVIVVESAGKKVGLIVDELLGQQQVVVKSLEANFKRIQGMLGGTILGDGSVSLILDVAGLLSLDEIHNEKLRVTKCY